MKNLRRMTGMLVVLGVIMMGAANAKAGMLMSDFAGNTNPDTCTVTMDKKDGNVDHGIIVTGLTQIFGKGLIESIFGKSDGQTNCGIIVTG